MTFDPVDLDVPQIIARQLQKGRQPKVVNLAEQIIDITIETSIQGASMLVLSIMDADWQLLTSGFISISEDGFLEPIDIHYPLKTAHSPGSWWRLAACEPTTDTTAANLSLTFEDRIVSLLRDKLGPKTAKPGTTREQFIASLVRGFPASSSSLRRIRRRLRPVKRWGSGRVSRWELRLPRRVPVRLCCHGRSWRQGCHRRVVTRTSLRGLIRSHVSSSAGKRLSR